MRIFCFQLTAKRVLDKREMEAMLTHKAKLEHRISTIENQIEEKETEITELEMKLRAKTIQIYRLISDNHLLQNRLVNLERYLISMIDF